MSAARHVRWSDVHAEAMNPLLTRQLVSGDQAMIARIQLTKGCVVPTHQHPNEQIATVVSGWLRFTLQEAGGSRDVDVRDGELLVIPGNVPHSAVAIEDTLNLDIFAPPRQDWLSGQDDYLRNSTRP